MTGTRDRRTIDVLIPVYNGAATIEQAIHSMTQQTLRDIRILVVDDGSTDETPTILRRLAATDPRIQVVTTPNGGIVDALNAGLALCTAEYVARFDADDIAFPERLQNQWAYLLAQPHCVAVGCSVHHINQQGSRTGVVSRFTENAVGNPFYAPAIEPYLLHPFLMARRDALVGCGGYRYVFHSEDADLYWRLAGTGRLINMPETLGEYRMHADSVSAKSILNGRIAAVSSQLAAISEQRRRAHKPDIDFPRSALERYRSAETLRLILDAASNGLSPEEKRYLESATAAKLLELSAHRPYRLTTDDFKTIRNIVESNYFSILAVNRVHLVFRQMIKPKAVRPLNELLHIMPWRVVLTALWEVVRRDVGKRLSARAGS